MDKLILGVKELNQYISDKIMMDALMDEVWIKGEVSGVGLRGSTMYFTMRDDEAAVDCIFFDVVDADAQTLETLSEGQCILMRGQPSLYRKTGKFRFIVHEVCNYGLGDLYARMQRMKAELEQQGVFDERHKKQIPPYPERIGIVTSSHGAVLRDIQNITMRRNPTVKLLCYHAAVQGASAPAELVRGIEYFDVRGDVDLIIIGRGGGSAEDLFAFNEKELVLAVFACKTPIISAVGHETDFSLCDLAADLRAPTPSAAAEIAVPAREDILAQIDNKCSEMRHLLMQRIARGREQIAYARRALSREYLAEKCAALKARVEAHRQTIQTSMQHNLYDKRQKLALLRDTVEHLSPYSAFARGYAIALKHSKAVRSIEQLHAGDAVELVLGDGRADATIVTVKGTKHG